MIDGPVVVAAMTHRDAPQVARLTERLLEGPRTAVVIHHDPRGPALRLPRSERIHLVPNPRECNWGRYGFARAMVDTVAFAHERIPDLSWLLLISGQDYLCRPMSAIEQELAVSTVNAYLRHFRVDPTPSPGEHDWQSLVRRRYLHSRRIPGSGRSMPFPRRHPFRDGQHLYAGDTWVNLDSSSVEHLLHQDQRLRHVDRYLRRCANSDEALLPTLLLNDSQHLEIANDRRRFIRWTPRNPHPEVLTISDLPAIRASSDFFLRKIDPTESKGLMDRLDSLPGDAG